jgi:hypothetical protein
VRSHDHGQIRADADAQDLEKVDFFCLKTRSSLRSRLGSARRKHPGSNAPVVQEAYRSLAARHTPGKIVLHPQEPTMTL